jgi:hypothetical protein
MDLTDHYENCDSKIDSIKKNVAELINYQHNIIKEQSNQLLSLIDVVNHSTKNLTDTSKELEEYKNNTSAYPQNMLFILVIICIVSFLMYKSYKH